MKINFTKTLAILEQVLNLAHWILDNLRPAKKETQPAEPATC